MTQSDIPFKGQFRLTNKAVERFTHKDGADEGRWDFVCSRLEVVALTHDSSHGNWGRLLKWKDLNGRDHSWAMPMELLSGAGEDVRRRLLSEGLIIASSKYAGSHLNDYLKQQQPKERVLCVDHIGWHRSQFIMPHKGYGEDGHQVILQTAREFQHSYRTSGTLEEWQNNIGKLAQGNSRLMFSLSAAFASPLLYLLNGESGGFHLRGASSIGKSTALVVAGSVWGGGSEGYIRQWRATDNGLEGLALDHCDTLLCLDEISQIDGKAIGSSIYMLANGAGKARAGKSGESRTVSRWRVLFLSNGEIGISDKMQEDGYRRVSAGQQVRVVDIPADAGAGMGLFGNIHKTPSPQAFAKLLKDNARRYYGIASRSYLEKLAKEVLDVADRVRPIIHRFTQAYESTGVDGQVLRVAERMGLIAAAGELAIEYGILPWRPDDASAAVHACMKAWVAQRGNLGPLEAEQAIRQVKLFLEQYGESRFVDIKAYNDTPTDDKTRSYSRAGYRRTKNGKTEYIFLREVWEQEVCRGFDAKYVQRVLQSAGYLVTSRDGNLKQERLPGVGQVRCVVVCGSVLEE